MQIAIPFRVGSDKTPVYVAIYSSKVTLDLRIISQRHVQVDGTDDLNPVIIGLSTELWANGTRGTWVVKGSNLELKGEIPGEVELPLAEGEYEIVIDQSAGGDHAVDGGTDPAPGVG